MRSVMMTSLPQDFGRFRELTALGVFCLFHHKVLDACAVEVRHRKPRTAQDKRKNGRYAGRVRLGLKVHSVVEDATILIVHRRSLVLMVRLAIATIWRNRRLPGLVRVIEKPSCGHTLCSIAKTQCPLYIVCFPQFDYANRFIT
jgi:hypothetical protein